MRVSKAKVAVPYFHSVQPDKDNSWIRNYLTLKLNLFEEYLLFLKRNKWQTIFLDEMYELRRKAVKVRGKYCVLTFDDGYVDNYIYAYPLLAKYGMKGTIFVSPECVDQKREKAESLFDIDYDSKRYEKISRTAYLNWDEIVDMQKSGVMDIQSHTMTHTKYFCSDKIVSFHHPGDDCIYQITNNYPELRPCYFNYPNFEKLIPFGTPFLEEKSAVLARIHSVNQCFAEEIISALDGLPVNNEYNFQQYSDKVNNIYNHYKTENKIIENIESDAEYQNRLIYEINTSKEVLERKLQKPVNFLCWPHGENNELTHHLALDCGYLATTVGKSGASGDAIDRFDRFGISSKKNMTLTKLKWKYKANSAIGEAPCYQIEKLYRWMNR